MFRSGFVAVTGKPNVGKSTLVNALVGKKVSIISPKRQTTRQRIVGVKNAQGGQIVFVDTPGLVSPRNLLGKAMIRHSREAVTGCDLCLFLVSATDSEPTEEDRWACKVLSSEVTRRQPGFPVYLVVNKVDRVKEKPKLLPLIQRYLELGNFKEVFPVSALKGENLFTLEKAMVGALPEGPPLFPPEGEEVEDSFYAAEVIREKVLFLVQQEVPHGVAVAVEEIRPGAGGKTHYVRATIYVERDSHKAIVVGAGGKMLKRIGTLARRELSFLWKEPVYLDLWVKVKERWTEREEVLRMLGYT